MLNEEDKKAIEYLTKYIHWETAGERSLETDIETVLNLITKLQKENEILKRAFDKQTADMSNNLLELQQKDKQIDLMAKKLNQAYFDEDKFCVWFEKMMGVQEKMDYGYVVDLIKQYFETKVKKGK